VADRRVSDIQLVLDRVVRDEETLPDLRVSGDAAQFGGLARPDVASKKDFVECPAGQQQRFQLPGRIRRPVDVQVGGLLGPRSA
jgi:hypothetical protein